MSLTLDLSPEVEARLVAEAERRNLPVSEVIALLVQGYFWSAESSLLQDWYCQESKRGLFVLKSKEAQIELRERLVEALTQEKNLESAIARQEREIARCEREAILSAQDGERAPSLKAYQKKVLHEQQRDRLKIQLPDAKAKAARLHAELRSSETAVLTNMAELLRMKLQRNRADLSLGRHALLQSVEQELEAKIRSYASESAWNAHYEEWISARPATIPEEAPSEIEIMNQAGEQNQRVLDTHLQRLEELHKADKPLEQEPSE